MIVEVTYTAKPGQYFAVRCDTYDCYEDGPDASTRQRAVKRALEVGFAFDTDGTATCPGCQQEVAA
jgi:hypothetical protein